MENINVETLVANQGLAMAVAIIVLVIFIAVIGLGINEFKKTRDENRKIKLEELSESRTIREQERKREEERHQEYIDIVKRTTRTVEKANTTFELNTNALEKLYEEFNELKKYLNDVNTDSNYTMSEIKEIVQNIEQIIVNSGKER